MENNPANPTAAADDEFVVLLDAFITEQAAIIQANRDRILTGKSADAVHQMRVAVRRVRCVLRSVGFGGMALQSSGKSLDAALGKVRDLDVLAERHAANSQGRTSASREYAEHLRRRRRKARKRLREALTGRHYRSYEQALCKFRQSLQPDGLTVREAAVKYIGAELERTKRKGRSIRQNTPDVELHRLRIQCKRLRYVADLFDAVPDLDLRRFSASAREMQHLLGEFNDERIAAQSLRRYAGHLPLEEGNRNHLVEAGRRIHAHESNARALRRDFVRVWEKFDAGCTKQALRREVRPPM